jgi:hypothetical protein
MDCIKDKVRGRGNDTSHLDPGDIPRILRGNERKCFSRVLKLSVSRAVRAAYQYSISRFIFPILLPRFSNCRVPRTVVLFGPASGWR